LGFVFLPHYTMTFSNWEIHFYQLQLSGKAASVAYTATDQILSSNE